MEYIEIATRAPRANCEVIRSLCGFVALFFREIKGNRCRVLYYRLIVLFLILSMLVISYRLWKIFQVL